MYVHNLSGTPKQLLWSQKRPLIQKSQCVGLK